MHLKDFTYELPGELIANYPSAKRDHCRLLVIDRPSQTIRHDIFANVGKYLPPESLLVVNNSKVIPARLLGKREKTGGKVEVFLLNKLSDGYSYETMLRPLGRLKVDEKIIFTDLRNAGNRLDPSRRRSVLATTKNGKASKGAGIYAQLKDSQKRIVRFNKKNIGAYLNRIGHVPLPPYIKRPDEALDKEFYQTVYAKVAGSVASPTAGLHFTKPLLNQLKKQGHAIEPVTLHINYATFTGVKEEDITKHDMHFESYEISKKAYKSIQNAKKQGRKIVAVGTTSCRVLETVGKTGKLKGDTNIFIYPGYQFQSTDVLITNFHLPASTLLMLVYAFGGMDLMRRAYAEAIQEKYRFYSYGDAMVIL